MEAACRHTAGRPKNTRTQRLEEGFDLEAVVREYGALRHAIIETAEHVGLPVSIGEYDAMAGYVTPSPSGLARHEALSGATALVVDDEDDARELLQVILESRDMIVHHVGSVSEALSLLAHTPVDVIVSDIGMPDQDGYVLIRSVHALANEEIAGTPAIALTAFTRNEDRTRALLEGFNVHMGKPVEPAELLATLAKLVAHGAKPAAPSGGDA